MLSTPRVTVHAVLLHPSAADADAAQPQVGQKRRRHDSDTAALDAVAEVAEVAAEFAQEVSAAVTDSPPAAAAAAEVEGAEEDREASAQPQDAALPRTRARAPAHGKLVAAYLCQLAGKRGRFNPEQAKALGIPPCDAPLFVAIPSHMPE